MSLAMLLAKKRLNPDAVIAILDKLAQETRKLHSLHISSNYLTLQNIFVDPENN